MLLSSRTSLTSCVYPLRSRSVRSRSKYSTRILDCVSDTAAAEMRAAYKVGFKDGVALMNEIMK